MFQLKKVKIVSQFNGRPIEAEIDSFKPVSFIFDTILTLIENETDIKLYYKRKEIPQKLNKPISEFFRFKKLIEIEIVKNRKSRNDLLLLPNIEENRNHKFRSSKNLWEKPISCDESRLSTLNNICDEILPNNNLKGFRCECRIFYINYFCRFCSKLVCRKCYSQSHDSHEVLIIDVNNIKECIKKYCKTLQSNSNMSILAFKQYYEEMNIKINGLKLKKQEIIRKFDEIQENHDKLIQIAKLKIGEDEINDLIQNGNEFNEEIDNKYRKIKEDLKKNDELTYINTLSYFNEVNKIEKKVEEITEVALNCKINIQLNNKIEEDYNLIEKTLFEILQNNRAIIDENNLKEEIFSENLILRYINLFRQNEPGIKVVKKKSSRSNNNLLSIDNKLNDNYNNKVRFKLNKSVDKLKELISKSPLNVDSGSNELKEKENHNSSFRKKSSISILPGIDREKTFHLDGSSKIYFKNNHVNNNGLKEDIDYLNKGKEKFSFALLKSDKIVNLKQVYGNEEKSRENINSSFAKSTASGRETKTNLLQITKFVKIHKKFAMDGVQN